MAATDDPPPPAGALFRRLARWAALAVAVAAAATFCLFGCHSNLNTQTNHLEKPDQPSTADTECFSNDDCCRHDAFDIAQRMLKAWIPWGPSGPPGIWDSRNANAQLVVSGRFEVDLPDAILVRGDIQATFVVDDVHFSTEGEPRRVGVVVATDRFAWLDTGRSRYLVRRDLMSDHYADMAPLIDEAYQLVMRRQSGTIDRAAYRRGAADIDARFAKLEAGGPLWDWEAGAAEIPGFVPRSAPWYRARMTGHQVTAIAELVPPLKSVKLDLDVPESPCVGFHGPIDPLVPGEPYMIVFRHRIDPGTHLYHFAGVSAGDIFSGQETSDLEDAIEYVANCLEWDEINAGPTNEIRMGALAVCATVARASLDGDPDASWTVKRNHLRWRRLEAVDPAFAKLRRDGPPRN